MCLIILSWRTRSDFPLILAANRDEFYDRPSLPADFWQDRPDILGGRDLKEGGTWLGITKKGRLAALTNYRDPLSVKVNAPSRGWLVKGFLAGDDRPGEYLDRLQKEASRYNGFSLILGDDSGLYYLSNRGGGGVTQLSPGIHGLSNHLLDTPWPKVGKARENFRKVVEGKGRPRSEDLFDLLADPLRSEDRELPDTGIGLEWERILSSVFIASPVYGTRSSTVLMIDHLGRVLFEERQFNGNDGAWMTARFSFRLGGNNVET
ncbi:MAG: NRDE family protein [Deltaproteobacteria bacterium]|nr:NRDE family protein [Deltaproteobacteria bacterium]